MTPCNEKATTNLLPKHCDEQVETGPQLETRKRLRVTTGCRTCRSRHVKCDEGKPSCKRCGKKGRKCVWGQELASHLPNTWNEASQTADQYPRTNDRPEERKRRPGFLYRGPQKRNFIISPILSQQAPDTRVEDSERPPISGKTSTPTSSQASPSANLASILGTADWDFKAVQRDRTDTASFRTASPATIEGIEVIVFRNYVDRVAHWLDAFSRDKPFSSHVPALALHCPVLLHSCLAFSGRQIALSLSKDANAAVRRSYERLSVYYYRTALQMLSNLLSDPECIRSDEILACSMTLSSYEMLDMVGQSFASHLKGLAALLQAQDVTGADTGVRGSVFWAWYRHESWSCVLNERAMTLNEEYWQPEPVLNFEDMTQEEIVNRVTFIYGQVVSFCNNPHATELDSVAKLTMRAQDLETALDDWRRKLPSWMVPFSIAAALDEASETGSAPRRGSGHPCLWFLYPQACIAHQVYHAGQILLALHTPQQKFQSHGFYSQPSLTVRRRIERSREHICLVARSSIPEEWAFISTQCLFVAGLVTEGKEERQQTLDIIEECQRVSGRQTWSIAERLRRTWTSDE